MSKEIVELAFGGGTDKAIELLADEMRRPIPLGTDWTHLAIAYRADVGPNNAFGSMSDGVLPFPGFCIGVCSGDVGPISEASCPHFVGISIGAATLISQDLDVDVNDIRRRASCGQTSIQVTKYENGSVSHSTFARDAAIYHGTIAGAYGDGLANAWPVAQCISISKSGSTHTVDAAIASSATYPTLAYSEETLSEALASGTMAGFASYFSRTYACPGGTITVDEATYGDLDTAVLTWPECFIPLRVYSFAVKNWS